jgi:hypothetical protein
MRMRFSNALSQRCGGGAGERIMRASKNVGRNTGRRTRIVCAAKLIVLCHDTLTRILALT